MIASFLNIKSAQQQGTVLISVLLYLSIITFLVVSAFSVSILQTKMSDHFAQEKQAFEYAESALFVAEDKIDPTKESGEGSMRQQATYIFHHIPYAQCGAFYQVDAIGSMTLAKVHLQSVFTFPHSGDNPCHDDTLKSRRVVWRQIDE